MCKFCELIQSGKEVLGETEHFVLLVEISPVSPGHLMIVSKRHATDVFALDTDWADFGNAVAAAKAHIESEHSPDGYNLGINCGTHAGQTIFHFHCHVIPRYAENNQEPEGGVCKMFKNAPPRGKK